MSPAGEDWGRGDRPTHDPLRDARDEIDFHIERRVEDNLGRGMDPEEARDEARRRFGDRASIESELVGIGRRRAPGRFRGWSADVLRDVRIALRSLIRRPLFAGVVVLTLALGIGSTTAVFSLVNWLLLRPVPGLPAQRSLFTVGFSHGSMDGFFVFSHLDFLDLRAATSDVAMLAGSYRVQVHAALPGGIGSDRITAELISDGYGDALGLAPVLGRVPEASGGEAHVTMISERLWARAFHSSPGVLGRTLEVNGRSFTVVGVAAPGFRGTAMPGTTDLWIPLEAHPVLLPLYSAELLSDRGQTLWIGLTGRRHEGVSIEEVAARLRLATERIVESSPGSTLEGMVPVVDQGVGLSRFARDQVRGVMGLLGAAGAFVLLLACANAANLLLARGAGRRGELSIRRAVGAGRGRLVRQLVTEATLLALAAGVVGTALAYGGMVLFEGERILSWVPPLEGVSLDGHVLAFALVMSFATGLAFGVVPSLLSTRDDGSRLRRGRVVGRVGPLRGLVVAQFGMSLVLMIGAGLLLGTVRAFAEADLGFEPRFTLETSVDPGTQGYDEERRRQFFLRLLEGTRALPRVRGAGLAWAPVLGSMRGGARIRPEGMALEDDGTLSAAVNHVSAGFIEAVGMRLVGGRDFGPSETLGEGPEPDVVIVSESTARRLFPGGSAVGRRVDMGFGEPRIAEIVGVVEDARVTDVRDPDDLLVLEPLGRAWLPSAVTLYVRGVETAPSPGALRALVADLDPAIPLYGTQPLERRVAVDLTVERLLARVTTLFAALALLLAAVGLYGVMSVAVHSRTREIGVRLALGARPDAVVSMIAGEGARTTLLGLVVGLVGAGAGARVLASRLWGVSPWEPSVFALSVATLVLAAAVACWTPARRATRVDPVIALRSD